MLSVCPVCDVGVLWPNSWTDQDETWHAGIGLRPGHIMGISSLHPVTDSPWLLKRPHINYSLHQSFKDDTLQGGYRTHIEPIFIVNCNACYFCFILAL